MSMNLAKKWFTLIEILIVVAIIALLLNLVMKFSGTQIGELRQKKEIETFKDEFNNLITKNINSNHINKQKYENIIIKIQEWEKDISIGYLNNEEIIHTWVMKNPFEKNRFENLYIDDWNTTTNIKIKAQPYIMWCEINNWDQDANFEINTPKSKLCFKINHKTCKIKEKKCED